MVVTVAVTPMIVVVTYMIAGYCSLEGEERLDRLHSAVDFENRVGKEVDRP